MYALLSTAAQARIGREVFVNRYTAIKEEAGIAKVTAAPAAGVPDNAVEFCRTRRRSRRASGP